MKRILLLEKSKKRTTDSSYVFEHLNVTVDCSGTVDDAIMLLQRHIYDAAIVDIQLPELNTVTLNVIVREKCPKIKIIAMTEQDEIISREFLFGQGFDQIFYKPFNFELLMEYIF